MTAPVRPRQLAHRGSVVACGCAFDVEALGVVEARRRVLASWAPGAQVLDAGAVIAVTGLAPHRVRVELAPGALPAMVDRPRGVAFIGQMHSMANRDAVAYLIREVWPEVRRRIPDARLHLIGPIAASDAERLIRMKGK